MTPFLIKTKDHQECLGILEYKKSRGSKKFYSTVNVGNGWDVQFRYPSEEFLYRDGYDNNMAIIANCFFQEFEDLLWDLNPNKVPKGVKFCNKTKTAWVDDYMVFSAADFEEWTKHVAEFSMW